MKLVQQYSVMEVRQKRHALIHHGGMESTERQWTGQFAGLRAMWSLVRTSTKVASTGKVRVHLARPPDLARFAEFVTYRSVPSPIALSTHQTSLPFRHV